MWICTSGVDSSVHSHADMFAYICNNVHISALIYLAHFYTLTHIPSILLYVFLSRTPGKNCLSFITKWDNNNLAETRWWTLSMLLTHSKHHSCLYFSQSCSTLLWGLFLDFVGGYVEGWWQVQTSTSQLLPSNYFCEFQKSAYNDVCMQVGRCESLWYSLENSPIIWNLFKTDHIQTSTVSTVFGRYFFDLVHAVPVADMSKSVKVSLAPHEFWNISNGILDKVWQ